ncbi:MAG TPA: hypothetical protein VFR58_14165 [Flavisolibacter sp.]|nr:hypothetical protein [Flavisolibacter sp.]
MSIQDYLFQQIKEKLPANASLADAIAGALHVSADSAYRRIRGETPLVLDEVRKLCEDFSVSLDEALRAGPSTVSFRYNQVNPSVNSFRDYLGNILDALTALEQGGSGDLIYLTKDIPVFYNFLFRPLFAFRYFFWMKSILQHPDFTHTPFSIDMLPAETEELGRRIAGAYARLPSTEIWNTECVNSTIAQVEYYREAGYFSSERDIQKIYDSLYRLLEHLREQAAAGAKFLPGESFSSKAENYSLFYNRVVLGDNTVLARASGRHTVYLSSDVLNYMVTTNEDFCAATFERLQTLMRRATLISQSSEKQRNIFFNILLKKFPNRASAVLNSSL